MNTLIAAWKIAAKKLGLSLADYVERRNSGEKFCRIHRKWHDRSAFGMDRHRSDGVASVCREAKNARDRARYNPAARHARFITKKFGLSFPEYVERNRHEKFCRYHDSWHDRSVFGVNRSRPDGLTTVCRDARNERSRARYDPVARHARWRRKRRALLRALQLTPPRTAT